MVDHVGEQRRAETLLDIEISSATEKIRRFILSQGDEQVIQAFEVFEERENEELRKQKSDLSSSIETALRQSELDPQVVETVLLLIHEEFFPEN